MHGLVLCRVAKEVGERIGQIRRMIGLLKGECVWVVAWWVDHDSVNECLKKWCLKIGQPKKMVYDRNEWQEFVMGNSWGKPQGMNSWLGWDAIVMGCHSYVKPFWVEVCLWPSLKLKGIKGLFSFLFVFLLLFYYPSWYTITTRW